MKKILFMLLIAGSLNSFAQVPRKSSDHDRAGRLSDVGPTPEPKYEDKAYPYQEKNKYGFIYNKVRQEAVYDKISAALKGYIVVKAGLYGICDGKGTPVTPVVYDSVGLICSHFLVKKKGLYGVLDQEFRPVLEPRYRQIAGLNNAVAFVAEGKEPLRMLFLSSGNKHNDPVQFAELYSNLAIVKVKGRFGLVQDGIILPFAYDSIFLRIMKKGDDARKPSPKWNAAVNTQYHLSQVRDLILSDSGRLGLALSSGEVIYPPENDEIVRNDMFGYYLVKRGKLNSIYFPATKKKTAFEVDRVYTDGLGFVMAVRDKKTGVYNLSGNLIVPFEYDDQFIMQLSNLGLIVTKDKKRGLVSSEGRMIIPCLYDDISRFYESGFEKFLKVVSGGKHGVLNLRGETVIPPVYEWIGETNGCFKVVTPEPDGKYGLYDRNGKMIIPCEYEWIGESQSRFGRITVLTKTKNEHVFLDADFNPILKESVTRYGYLHDDDNLISPSARKQSPFLLVKNKEGKFGMINEMTGTADIPMEYDSILQYTESAYHTHYSVKKGKYYGLINEKNEVRIPFIYNSIDLDLSSSFHHVENDSNLLAVVSKNGLYGAVSFCNVPAIPLRYTHLKCVLNHGYRAPYALYKAKKDGKYTLISAGGKEICPYTFDEVALFERTTDFDMQDRYDGYDDPSPEQNSLFSALTFSNGKMRVITETGVFTGTEVPMRPHEGYKSFEELKQALIRALDKRDTAALREFAVKIAPSAHILYYLKQNVFDESPLSYGAAELSAIRERYFSDLLSFMEYWHSQNAYSFDRSHLTDVNDYTHYREEFVTNYRHHDHAFGDSRFLEKLLRNAIKVNGYWISTYFMTRSFDW